jgi:hypothetical protein
MPSVIAATTPMSATVSVPSPAPSSRPTRKRAVESCVPVSRYATASVTAYAGGRTAVGPRDSTKCDGG